MNPGELDRRIRLYSVTEHVRSTTNEVVVIDALYGEVWAKYETATESELIIDDEGILITPATFKIRYIKTITEDWRLKYNNKIYAILSIETTDGRENYLTLRCESTQQTNFKT